MKSAKAKSAGVRRQRDPEPAAAEEAPAVVPKHQGELLDDEEIKEATFESLGLCPELASACRAAGWRNPTRIQAATFPTAVHEARDLVGVAQTGSGKTGAYVLPILQWLLTQPKTPHLAALILVPTRELAVQVSESFSMLGASIGLKVATLVGGEDMVSQGVTLSLRPHVVVGTPGRVKDHFQNTKGFRMPHLKWLVLDEADKMLDMDYEKEIDAILDAIKPLVSLAGSNTTLTPVQRQTMLFSATLSTKVDRLQKASLRDPVLLRVHRANTTVDTLKQLFVFVPFAQMLAYMHVYLARIETGSHIIVFCPSAVVVHKVTLALRVLGHRALPLMGRMSQENRQRALQQFKEGKVRILVCTDLAQRGLDIAHTDVVVNYSLPLAAKEYIHRVGRTARAGSHGKAVNFITQYDILALQSIEATTGVKMEELQVPEDAVQAVAQRVAEAELEAAREVKEQQRIDECEKQHQEMAAPSGPSRRRQSASTMGADDANHGKANFGVTRMRRENEEKFATTTKQQRQTLQQKRREAVRK